MITLASVAITMIVALVSLVYGQTVEFKSYTNNEENFTIQYPAHWEVEETDPDIVTSEVTFNAPERPIEGEEIPINTGLLQVIVNDIPPDTQYLDTDTMTVKNITTNIQQYAQEQLNEVANSDALLASDPSLPLTSTYKLIRSQEFPVAGKPGWKIEYIWGDNYYLRVFAFMNDKVYELWHSVNTLEAPKTFPLANKMVESFQVGIK